MSLRVIPLELAEANALVERWHRHHRPVIGHRFSIGVADGGRVCGAAIIGRPVARAIDHATTVEILRLVTDGTANACSKLLSASWRAARALGYTRCITYTLATENGASLRAAGWRVVGEVRGRSWSTPSRPRVDKHPTQDKLAWEAQ